MHVFGGVVDRYFTSVEHIDDTVTRVGASTPERGWDEFAPLYDEHHERLYRLALLLCRGRTHVAEDAVAETFISVYRVWSTGGVDDFGAYSRRALVNHITGRARREQVAARYLAKQPRDGAIRGADDERIVENAATFELLGQLPPKQRAAIVLRFYEDLPYEQIATELGVSVGTVKAQVSTGLQRLRLIIGTEASR
jgi:RNA polymerase sigma factor (sigma-70 family)